MNFSDYPEWILSSIAKFQLSVDDRWTARSDLRHHVEAKFGGYGRRKKEALEVELTRLARLEDWGLCQDFIHAFQPRLDVADDLWRRCDRLYWRYRKVWAQDPDEFFMLLRVVRYTNLVDQLEPGRDYEALWEEARREEREEA